MAEFVLYILKCNDASYYVGHTDNYQKRLTEHVYGKYSGYTASRLPITVVFTQVFQTRIEALSAERQIKGWARKKKEAFIKGDWELLSKLAKRKQVNEDSLVQDS